MFKEIRTSYDWKLDEKLKLNINGEECEMYLFRVSRLRDEKDLDELVAVHENCKYFEDDVNFPVCAAFPARGKMFAIYPYSKCSVRSYYYYY